MEKLIELPESKTMIESYLNSNKDTEIFEPRFIYNKIPPEVSSTLAAEIRANYESISPIGSNITLLDEYHKKITSHMQMLKDVLTYEFLFYTPDHKIDNLDELFHISDIEMKKYQGIIGGYHIEDTQWLVCDNETSKRFKIGPGQKAVYNSCDRENCFNDNLVWFLKQFKRHMKRFIGNPNLTVDYKLYDDETNQIGWILFVCEDKILNSCDESEESDDDENNVDNEDNSEK